MKNKTNNYYIEQFKDKILNSGIDDTLPLNEKRIIKLINIGAILSGLFCVLVLLLAIFIINDLKVIVTCFLLAIAYFLIPFINKLKLFSFTKLFVLLYFSSVVIFWNLYISETPYFLILPFTITSIFYTKYIYRILGLILFFIIFSQLKYYPYSADDISLIFYDFFLFFSVLVLLGFIHEGIQKYERKMNDLNESLIIQNKKLEQQQQLKKSEQFFRSIFENNYLGIVVLDRESNVMRVNPAFCEQVGFEASDILHRRFIDFNIDRLGCLQQFKKLVKGEIRHFETQERLKRKDDRVMNAQLIVNGVYDVNGDFLEAIITVQDVTKTFKTQTALKESELKFRTIFDNSPMGITIAHLKTEKVVDINQGALKALGLTKEKFFELQEKNLLANKTNIRNDNEIIKTLLNEDVKSVITTKHFKKTDGSELIAELTRSIINIHDDDYVVTVSKDITADIMIEQERKARYHEMQTFFDALPISFLYLDTENKVLRGNKIALGNNTEIYEGEHISELFPMITTEYLSITDKIVSTGNAILNQIEHYQIKNNEIWVRVDRIPVKDKDGTVTGIIVFSTDITEVKKAEGELAVKNATLEHYIETNLQLESFAYIASHDLKEPLRMIHSFTQLLNRRLKLHFDEDTTDYMNYILSGVHRMQNLLDDLLKYSMIGRKEKNLELVDLNDTIYNVIQNVQHSVQEKKAEILIEPLPKVKAFPIQMVQLFQNLMSNAMKFVPDGKQPNIKIKVKEGLKYYEFEVNDNGIGIQKEYLQKIFLVFKRLHGKEEYDGTGIGLATCKKIIESLNGQIWVESDYGKGTSFFFTIPKQ